MHAGTEETNDRPAGRLSVTTTLGATTGPVFVTVITYGTRPPGETDVDTEVFVIATVGDTGSGRVDAQSCAVACNGPVAGVVSIARPAGGQLVSGAVTDAVLGTKPSGSTDALGNGLAASVTMLRVATAPGARVAMLQVTIVGLAAVQPSGDETNVKPCGQRIGHDDVGRGCV